MARFTAALLGLFFVLPHAHAQSGSPALTEPEEIASTNGKLRAVIVMRDTDTQVPNVGKRHLRYFQGWKLPDDASALAIPEPPASRTFTPGPTLRARVGEKVEIMFFNEVNEKNFAYTNDGSDCDKTFSRDADGKTIAVYPFSDQYPNCFHGSSTANLHFHGTHTSPDGLGDNVLVEVIPNKDRSREAQWAKIFEKVFAGPIPQTFGDMPPEYWEEQKKLLPPALLKTNEAQIANGDWPQYIIGAFPNAFVLPNDPGAGSGYTSGQAPGTHWYHAHKHGSTALHMLNGLAGVFVIEGPYDQYLKDYYGLKEYGDFEKILIFQQIGADLSLEKQLPTAAGQVLVNGQNMPTIEMKRGEVQLWRLVNATPGGTGGAAPPGMVGPDLFTTANFTFRQTAQDGVQFSPANYAGQPFITTTAPGPPAGLTLAGGNRADVLVRAPDKAGTYPLKSNKNGTVTLYVRVTDDARAMCLPGEADPCPAKPWPAIPGFLTDLTAPAASPYPHRVSFGWDPEPGRAGVAKTTRPPKFTIDNKQFAERGLTVDQCMRLGDTKDNRVQDWVLENNSPTIHPFHIHINPFQILSIETPSIDATGKAVYTTYTPKADFLWQDVVAIPAAVAVKDQNGKATQGYVPGRVTIRHRFVDFTGTFVLHCHILAHEDRGMMQLVRVVKPDDYPEKCQTNIPHHH
jgi:FtsP/CotA-like multicopper oxidase with cupredoxin domain